MERTRGSWMVAVFYGQITVILLLQSVQQASSVFQTTLKCTGGTDGKAADAPCMIDAYLGSTVQLSCAAQSYTKKEPDYLTAKTGNVCKKKLAADPATCASGDKVTYDSLGLGEVLITTETLMVPFKRSTSFKAPVIVYGRCAKSSSEALYWGIKFIPRPKFPDVGRILSCGVPVETAGQVCELSANLSDYAVFECPPKSPVLVPAQTSDRPHLCSAAMATAGAACSSAVDVAGEGVTLTQLKNGSTVSAISFKAPVSKTGSKSKVEGYVNCKGTDKTYFYKYSLSLTAGQYKMNQDFKVCDPGAGEKQGAPCSADLNVGETYVINCSGLGKTAPGDLMKSTGSYCSRPVKADATDLCADDTALWKDIGAEVFRNADNLVLTHKKSDLAKTMTVYGKCFDSQTATYFKVSFTGATSTGDKEPKKGNAFSAPSKLAVLFGVLGTVFLATDAACKIF